MDHPLQDYVGFEGHSSCTTLYVVGWLADPVAQRVIAIIDGVAASVRVLRVDLRSVSYIEPQSFVQVARAPSRWREHRNARVTIEFPSRSRPATVRRQTRPQLRTIGTAVSTAISCPMSTSPG